MEIRILWGVNTETQSAWTTIEIPRSLFEKLPSVLPNWICVDDNGGAVVDLEVHVNTDEEMRQKVEELALVLRETARVMSPRGQVIPEEEWWLKKPNTKQMPCDEIRIFATGYLGNYTPKF